MVVRRPWGACWMEGENPLPLKQGGGGGRGGIPCPLPSRPPHLRQPFQLTPTPSPAPHQETFQNDEKLAVFGSRPQGPGPKPLGARAPSRWGPGPKPLWAPSPCTEQPSPEPWPNLLHQLISCARCSPGDFEKRHLLRLVAPIDFRSPGHPKRSAGRPA